MGLEQETVDAFFRAVSRTLARTSTIAPRNRCDEEDRCVYDRKCPFFADCELTDYSQ